MAEHFGLDIGADSIKIVQFKKEKNSFVVTAAGMAKNPLANFNFEDEKGFVALAEAIKKLKQEARVTTNAAAVSLPERSVFTQVIEMPKMSERELEQAVPWEAEDVIPRSLAEVNLDWEVLEEEEGTEGPKIKVLLVAAPSSLVNKYLQLLKLAEVETLSLEPESLAAVRALQPVIKTGNAVLINMGEKSLDVFLVHRGHLCLSRQLPSAGEALTRTVASTLGLDLTSAEEYKKTYGLSPQVEGKVAAALAPVLSSAVGEIQKI
ncbi:MAG: type IV pilus assembly protein PilM, partial [Microgenomates group bacterium]